MNQAVKFETLINTCDIGKACQKMHKQYLISVNSQGDQVVVSLIAVWGVEESHAELKKIYIKHETEMDQVVKRIARLLAKHPKAKVLLNTNGTGQIVAEFLNINEIPFKAIHWGGACFRKENQEAYVDKRAQAYVCLSRALAQGRFSLKNDKFLDRIIKQLINIPYELDNAGRFRVFSNKEMQELGLPLPDISETLAYVFLEGITGN